MPPGSGGRRENGLVRKLSRINVRGTTRVVKWIILCLDTCTSSWDSFVTFVIRKSHLGWYGTVRMFVPSVYSIEVTVNMIFLKLLMYYHCHHLLSARDYLMLDYVSSILKRIFHNLHSCQTSSLSLTCIFAYHFRH